MCGTLKKNTLYILSSKWLSFFLAMKLSNQGLPSGKHPKNYGKSAFSNWVNQLKNGRVQ